MARDQQHRNRSNRVWQCLLVLPLLMAVLIVAFLHPYYQQEKAVREIEKLGVYVLREEMVESRLYERWLKAVLPTDWLWNPICPISHVITLDLSVLPNEPNPFLFGPFIQPSYEARYFTDREAAALQSLIHLRELILSGTQVSDEGFRHLSRLSDLRYLDLSHADIGDEGMKWLSGLVNLRTLSLAKTRITDEGLQHLRGMTQLEWLELSGTQIDGSGLVHISGMQHLDQLNLSMTNVDDDGTRHLSGLSNLSILIMDKTRVSDEGLKHLRGLHNLFNADFRDTQVTVEGAKSLKAALPGCGIWPAPQASMTPSGAWKRTTFLGW